MKYLYAFLALLLAIFLVDLMVSYAQEIWKERQRQKNIARFAMSQFNGTRKSTWLS
jgi:hypothetical protein